MASNGEKANPEQLTEERFLQLSRSKMMNRKGSVEGRRSKGFPCGLEKRLLVKTVVKKLRSTDHLAAPDSPTRKAEVSTTGGAGGLRRSTGKENNVCANQQQQQPPPQRLTNKRKSRGSLTDQFFSSNVSRPENDSKKNDDYYSKQTRVGKDPRDSLAHRISLGPSKNSADDSKQLPVIKSPQSSKTNKFFPSTFTAELCLSVEVRPSLVAPSSQTPAARLDNDTNDDTPKNSNEGNESVAKVDDVSRRSAKTRRDNVEMSNVYEEKSESSTIPTESRVARRYSTRLRASAMAKELTTVSHAEAKTLVDEVAIDAAAQLESESKLKQSVAEKKKSRRSMAIPTSDRLTRSKSKKYRS